MFARLVYSSAESEATVLFLCVEDASLRLGRVTASDSCFLGLDSQLPLVASEVGGWGHQSIYGPHGAGHKLDIPAVQ